MKDVDPILTDRLLLRQLTVSDASEEYLGWFGDDEAGKYIVSAAQQQDIEKLKDFIAGKINRDDILFLGIFDRLSGTHIGNIKYEPVDAGSGYAIMGILIGNKSYRGKGITQEALRVTAGWLKRNKDIHTIVLGVHAGNLAAINAYKKVGFRVTDTKYITKLQEGCVAMEWHI